MTNPIERAEALTLACIHLQHDQPELLPELLDTALEQIQKISELKLYFKNQYAPNTNNGPASPNTNRTTSKREKQMTNRETIIDGLTVATEGEGSDLLCYVSTGSFCSLLGGVQLLGYLENDDTREQYAVSDETLSKIEVWLDTVTKIDKYSNGDYQRAVSEFVSKHVHQCASTLVSDVSPYFAEDAWLEISHQYDWTQPALDHVTDMARSDVEDELITAGMDETADAYQALYRALRDQQIDAQDFCDNHNIDPYTIEAYEHWIISDSLARWLEEKDEMVTSDFFGLTIWGRTTTGQSISMDRVICDIFDELNPEWEESNSGKPEPQLDHYYRTEGGLVAHVETLEIPENEFGPLITVYLNDEVLFENR